ncbi:hypothetical protein BGW36DRAFT_390057 [Talaromyces proteolyticus]|uniref:BZIP domain-containing protein n=1 Tax=Talaromyces proteolyticus TaxID=1131652 RepID=A0AAD4KEG3_9EURO|nr:uncharacterized protein BGW36DRAFT_390057 [Talaromyces proteolyticus]KAH8690000.1 hypothetical protein BGW36DRAFT_390057 [Talaromyces proteolyticus]
MFSHQNVPTIQLQPMSQLAEAIYREDDWTGLTDAAARRKRQNRLNVRAYRKRRAQQSKASSNLASTRPKQTAPTETQIPCWVERQQRVVHIPALALTRIYKAGRPLIPWQSAPFLTSEKPRKISLFGEIIFPLSSDHLIPLLQFNVLRGLLTLRHLLSPIRPQDSQPNECSSAALYVLPDISSCPESLPEALKPTYLQQTVPHEEWVDSIPHPVWRDNVIQALGTFDEDQLWSDTIGGLFEGFPSSEIEKRGVICWSTPWHPSGWEISAGFLRRWGWSFKGCEADVMETTNKWRALRGENPLAFEY